MKIQVSRETRDLFYEYSTPLAVVISILVVWILGGLLISFIVGSLKPFIIVFSIGGSIALFLLAVAGYIKIVEKLNHFFETGFIVKDE